eukprot:GHVN01066133.1.p1 GENE.GHVN01066133.1~~GHVN01066133.1.p1  ORF type:complete len:1245 (-),score=203.17 GHVN01066133.1:5962-9696(-)
MEHVNGGEDSPHRRESGFVEAQRQLNNPVHLQSASLDDKQSPLQLDRQRVKPLLPIVLKGSVKLSPGVPTKGEIDDAAELKQLFPTTWGQEYHSLQPISEAATAPHPPMRIGVVLSGGQAAGGHNVIAGVFDYIKQRNPNSQLIGFLGGPEGIYTKKYINITEKYMDQFRNQGGFDMIRSGRHKIESEEHKAASMKNCGSELGLDGLIVIGGDDSNTNAAVLAEYFKKNGCKTKVIGCPKTIDGDLRNQYVEASFGFDTAIKTFSEFIGNLCTDIATSGKYYHFVRIMGRSASHLALECAMQTRPNMVLIGEEVKEKDLSMKNIVDEIVELIKKRHEMGRDYGVILVPEGLIEFSREIGKLIVEINEILAKGEWNESKLSVPMKELFLELPPAIRNELLLERDPHGNVQVAKIATERLLILMVEKKLKNEKMPGFVFEPKSHYFGYEGRCAMPSNFDSNYCYTLGHTAAALVDKEKTGYMAVVRDLHLPATEWKPAGCPLTIMMNIERRHGKSKPVIKKFVVELDGPLFKVFEQAREAWKTRDLYRSPGPIQFTGPSADDSNYTIKIPSLKDLVPEERKDYDKLRQRHFFVQSESQMSPLQVQRLSAQLTICPQLTSTRYTLKPNVQSGPVRDPVSHHSVVQSFPLQVAGHKGGACGMTNTGTPLPRQQPLRIGVALTGQQSPGVANIVWGLWERLQLHTPQGKVVGFVGGAQGLLSSPPRTIEVTKDDLELCRNQGGFELLGRDPAYEGIIAKQESLIKIKTACQELNLDGLVLIGGRWTMTDVSVITEYFLTHSLATRVIGVPATQNNNLDGSFIEASLGFDSASKCYSSLIGNLLTDSASATKYWYFIRLMGRDKSQMVLEAALQTHPNLTLVSECYAAGDKTIDDCVKTIADCVCRRAADGKNFGAVLIPEGLISALPQFRQLVKEVNRLLPGHKKGEKSNSKDDDLKTQEVYNELVAGNIDLKGKYTSLLSPWSLALLNTLPQFFRQQIIQPRHHGRLALSQIATEELLSQLVETELAKRSKEGEYSGSFSPVCFYFGYQGRSSLPSRFDCTLGLSHGYLSGACVESGLTGYVTSMRGLCGPTSAWRPVAFPVTSISKLLSPDTDVYGDDKVPLVASDMVKLDGRPYRKVACASRMWELEDRFCNPGPMQFTAAASHYYSRYLFEEHHSYLNMLSKVGDHLEYIRSVCGFGVDKTVLRTTALTLETLKKILGYEEGGERDEEERYTEQMMMFKRKDAGA